MKTATYELVRVGKPAITGIVTQNYKGKVSISLPYSNKYNSSIADRYAAKNLGKQIVLANFEHPAIKNLVDNTDSKDLIEKLKDATIELKTEYVAKCKIWETENFKKEVKWIESIKALSLEELYLKFNISFTKKQFGDKVILVVDRNRSNLLGANELNVNIKKTEIYLAKGLEKNIEAAELSAMNHYEDSIAKLAYKLFEKGISAKSDIKIISSRIGQNFECIISFEEIKIKAWTIIAEGPIQRPHYRYLVK